MKLDKITLKSVEAKEARKFIEAIEQLPEDIVKGNYFWINVYGTGGVNRLAFTFDKKEDQDRAEFNIPNSSSDIRSSRYSTQFYYNGVSYHLTLEEED